MFKFLKSKNKQKPMGVSHSAEKIEKNEGCNTPERKYFEVFGDSLNQIEFFKAKGLVMLVADPWTCFSEEIVRKVEMGFAVG